MDGIALREDPEVTDGRLRRVNNDLHGLAVAVGTFQFDNQPVPLVRPASMAYAAAIGRQGSGAVSEDDRLRLHLPLMPALEILQLDSPRGAVRNGGARGGKHLGARFPRALGQERVERPALEGQVARLRCAELEARLVYDETQSPNGMPGHVLGQPQPPAKRERRQAPARIGGPRPVLPFDQQGTDTRACGLVSGGRSRRTRAYDDYLTALNPHQALISALIVHSGRLIPRGA